MDHAQKRALKGINERSVSVFVAATFRLTSPVSGSMRRDAFA
jgi:hypothetical protein